MTAAPGRRFRLAAVTSHPVQYQAPLFQRLAAHPEVDLTVFYSHDESVVGGIDPDFGVRVAWDRPLLDGYRSVVLHRRDSDIVRHLWQGRFDAVFIHSYATRLSLLAYAGALLARTPILLRTESELLRPRSWWVATAKDLLLRPLFGLTSAFLVIGEANRRFFHRFSVPPGRQFWTPYSVDNDFLAAGCQQLHPRREELRRAFGFPDDVVVAGFSGKLIPRKNAEELIDAIAALQSEGRRVGALLVGDGPDRAALERRVAERHIRWIAFAGFRNQTELPACFVCFDLFVLPARFDSWGLVVNEAMACGLPVIATDMVGAGLDLIEPDGNGAIYPSGDVRALTDALRPLVDSADLRERFGRRSRDIIRGYSLDVCVTGIVDAVRHAAGVPIEATA